MISIYTPTQIDRTTCELHDLAGEAAALWVDLRRSLTEILAVNRRGHVAELSRTDAGCYVRDMGPISGSISDTRAN